MNNIKNLFELVEENNALLRKVESNQRIINSILGLESEEISKEEAAVKETIAETNTENVENSFERVAAEILLELGVPVHIKGYRYVLKAITLVWENVEMLSLITKLLYPTIAKEFFTSPSRVERAIRHAIETGWVRGNADLQNKIFANTVSAEKSKPTNSEFIAMIVEYIRLQKM